MRLSGNAPNVEVLQTVYSNAKVAISGDQDLRGNTKRRLAETATKAKEVYGADLIYMAVDDRSIRLY